MYPLGVLNQPILGASRLTAAWYFFCLSLTFLMMSSENQKRCCVCVRMWPACMPRGPILESSCGPISIHTKFSDVIGGKKKVWSSSPSGSQNWSLGESHGASPAPWWLVTEMQAVALSRLGLLVGRPG